MLDSLLTRAARASVAGTLVFSLGLAPALAHMASFSRGGPVGRPGMAFGHSQPFGARGLNRFGSARFGFNRFGFDRFGFNHFSAGRFGFDRFGFNHFSAGRFGFNRRGFNRFGWNANAGNWGQLGIAGSGYGGYTPSSPTAPAAPIILGAGGPPVVINVYPGGGSGEVGGAAPGACVIHQLKFDSAGKYVGEQQYPQC